MLGSALRLTGLTVPTVIGQIVVTAAVAGFTTFVMIAGLVAAGVAEARWPSFVTALSTLEASEMLETVPAADATPDHSLVEHPSD